MTDQIAEISGINYRSSQITDTSMKKSTILSLAIVLLAAPALGYRQADLDKLKAINQCIDCQLTEAPLYGVNLSKVNMRAANLDFANLERAILREANLVFASLRGAYLIEAELRYANFSEGNLSGANLLDANLTLSLIHI